MSDNVSADARFGMGRAATLVAPWLAAGVILTVACAGTAPPPTPPPPEPAPVTAPVGAPAEAAPKQYVRVTGSKLNLRESPRTSARSVGKLARGTRVEKRGEDGEWLQVVLPDGTTGWVNARYVTAEMPCPADSVEPEVLSSPPVAFASDGGHGRVVLEATVSRSGDVAAVAVKENTTGSADLAKVASDELHQVKFKPFIRGCKAVPFIYVFTRNYGEPGRE
jgi:hypothetical protein